ncbi:uncharacterized protein TRIADDRAFT_61268 [Trichoplax adhaerens]|uniref:Dihydrolipoyllysine-residue succinyltransferase component of 2-oxoglutarate dehydrogenase complex, mitochondrial n=1 Tax=Trichoplax adhaerens TaxID=10228 RepID=B3SAI2_TRIAD|nr:hypothetical protein TRIADDRAFT_61268 [Trichoplax adhaerens]EDV20316.1 hypothetical protein TRIADDRAFT_61268 [Trichoplax adhaerens]|eukprot:XP_002117266.1 hypothetical protein TRIADDRAFT_61268 [Trichoplax adhaerens]
MRLFDNVITIQAPTFPESISEGDIRWLKEVGDTVEENDTIGEIETDKTTMAVLAPESGVIEEFLIPDGEKVTQSQNIAKFKVAAGSESGSQSTETKAPSPSPATAETKEVPPNAESPPAQAAEIPSAPPPVPNIPESPISATPIPPVSQKRPIAAAVPQPIEPMPSGVRSERRVKMSRMRLRIAERLKAAQNTCAMLTTFNEVDMSNVIEMRNAYKESFLKKHGAKLSFMSPFIKASAFALRDQPVINAVIDGKEIIYRDYVDISIAVATPKGLVVPVLRNVETMNYGDIEKNVATLAEKARHNNITVEDMEGGTFTISNGGVFGSLFGTPIINPPQSAILGMHGVFDRPIAVKGKVEIRPMMYIALTYDHRLVDGREAVLFLRKIHVSFIVRDRSSLGKLKFSC